MAEIDAGDEQPLAQPADEYASHAAGRRQQQALGKRLPDESRAAGADGRAHGHLTLARERPHEDEIRHVQARQPEDERGEREKKQRHDRDRRGERALRKRPRQPLRKHAQPALAIGVRVVALDFPGHVVHGLLRGLEAHARREAAVERERPQLTIHEHVRKECRIHGAERVDREVRGHVRPGVHAEESLRRHADDRGRLAVDPHARVEHRGIATEPVLPARVAQHDEPRAARVLAVAGREQPAECGLEPQAGEEIVGDPAEERGRRPAAGGQAADPRRERKQIGEGERAVAQVGQRRVRQRVVERVLVPPRLAANRDNAAGVGHGQRSQVAVQQTEDGGVRADADRERDDRAGGEARLAHEGTDAVSDVLEQCLEPRQAAPIALVLLELREAAERELRLPCRDLGRHAAALVLGGEQRDMRANLDVEVSVVAVAEPPALDPREPGGEPAGHHRGPFGKSRTRPTRPATRSHRAVSAARCFRPAAVIA